MGLEIASTPESLTSKWLTSALQSVTGGAQITDVNLQPLGTGQMCDSFRVHLRFDKDTTFSPTIVAKLPAADETSRATAKSLRSYEKEVRFYQTFAAQLPIKTPEVLYSDIETESSAFILLLEDLAPAVQGDQLSGCSVGEAEVAIDQMVLLHAPYWGSSELLEHEWLIGDPDSYREFMSQLLPALWQGFQDRYSSVMRPHVLEAGNILFPQIDSYLAPRDCPQTIVHGDFRLDNLLFLKGDSPQLAAVVDWQTVGHGYAMTDVAYFVGAGLLENTRSENEELLVRRYFNGLTSNGVMDYSWEQCWSDYRRSTWSGLIMAVAASMLVERTQRGDEMFLAMANRHAQHALDLKSTVN